MNTFEGVAREIEKHALNCGIPRVEEWAVKWLSGEDRSWLSAVRAESVADWMHHDMCREFERTWLDAVDWHYRPDSARNKYYKTRHDEVEKRWKEKKAYHAREAAFKAKSFAAAEEDRKMERESLESATN